ncbi:hypothetical protein OH492_13340 [Vibrio chagasii]|nr:hypothetical protein [Vibrio chagasii]
MPARCCEHDSHHLIVIDHLYETDSEYLAVIDALVKAYHSRRESRANLHPLYTDDQFH